MNKETGSAKTAALFVCGVILLVGAAAAGVTRRGNHGSRIVRPSAVLFIADGGDAADPADGGDAADPDGGDALPADGGDALPADGGDALPADGGDAAAADGGDASADGGDATVSVLDTPYGTTICQWNWASYTSGSLNPLTSITGTGGALCNINENAAPNQTGGNSTAGFTYIGNRTSKMMFNNTSGGWSTFVTGPLASTSGNVLLRVAGVAPATWASITVVTIQGESNAALLKLSCDATPRCIGSYDDGPGSLSTAVVTGVTTSKAFFADVYLDDSTHKVTLCYNGTCTVGATASGSTSIATPDAIGIGNGVTGTPVAVMSLLDVSLQYSVTGWTTVTSIADCAAITGSACSP